VPSLVGWGLLAGLIILVAVAVPLIPGFTLRVGALAGLGAVLGIALGVAGVAVFASLFGVVLLERGGPRRCLTLLSGRFWATLGRVTVAGLLYAGYGLLVGLLTAWLSRALGMGGIGSVVGSIVEAALLIPVWVYVTAVSLVTYAELRHRENRATSTRTLAAELTR
jgi:hypothetical protein